MISLKFSDNFPKSQRSIAENLVCYVLISEK
jgi:hypothetical protein